MSQLITVKMFKSDNQPWGFRLQGGTDFGLPLSIQKVRLHCIPTARYKVLPDKKRATNFVICIGSNFVVFIYFA